MLDLLHLTTDADGDAAQNGHERKEEEYEHRLEDAGCRQEGRGRGPRDRLVVLEEGDDARSTRQRDRCVGAKSPSVRSAWERRRIAAYCLCKRLADVFGL